MKVLLFLQAALGSLSTRIVPAGTARAIVEHVAPVTATDYDRVIRRTALHVLALVFLRSRQITSALGSGIRAVFREVQYNDPDETIRSFAKLTLSAKGALEQRPSPAVATTSRRVSLRRETAGRKPHRKSNV